MKKIFNIIAIIAMATALTGCYDGYISDYRLPNMGFAMQKPLRTVVSTTNKIYVGVSIGGYREVDQSMWANFSLDETLLAVTGLTMLPDSYYKLSDPNMFKVRYANLPVADVAIEFTDAFYADEKCKGTYYALPFRLLATSIENEDSKYGAIRAGAETSVVAIKYICGYSGTYYRYGKIVEKDDTGAEVSNVSYKANALSLNKTVTLTTLGKNTISCPGLGNTSDGGLVITIDDSGNLSYEGKEGGPAVTVGSGKFTLAGEHKFFGGDEAAPQIDLSYQYTKGGHTFEVTETLVLRQWAERDLRVESF